MPRRVLQGVVVSNKAAKACQAARQPRRRHDDHRQAPLLSHRLRRGL